MCGGWTPHENYVRRLVNSRPHQRPQRLHMAKKKKKKAARTPKRVKAVRIRPVANRPDSLPTVRPINSSELRPAEREQERKRARDQGADFLFTQMAELMHSMMCMDRVFMRNAIYRIQLCVEEHSPALQLTAVEHREWTRLASAALLDTAAQHVPQHCKQIISFWDAYRRSM
jgi:hypothetical protein